MDNPKSTKVFLSYAHKDGTELVQRLHDDLSGQGYHVWLDVLRVGISPIHAKDIQMGILTSNPLRLSFAESRQPLVTPRGFRSKPVSRNVAAATLPLPMRLTGVASTDIKLFEFIVRMSLQGATLFEASRDFSRGESTLGKSQPQPPARRQTTTMRIVRDTEKSRRVKEVYDYTCQVCGVRLETPAGPYAEGAHIKPLGIPHNGPDDESNILCLCPNHHVLLDDGAITLADDFRVLGVAGEPQLCVKHGLGIEYLRYHREHFGVLVEK